MTQGLRLLACDFDGVIADSMPAQEDAWRQAVRRVAPDKSIEGMIVKNLYEGCAGPRMFTGIHASSATTKQLRTVKDHIWRATKYSTPPMAGLDAALAEIAPDWTIAIVTTADIRYVTALLDRWGIRQWFSRIVTDQDVENPKPAPDMVLRLLAEFGAERDRARVVGDSRTDYQMSIAAGVPFIRFASHEGAADVPAPSVASWSDLARNLTAGLL